MQPRAQTDDDNRAGAANVVNDVVDRNLFERYGDVQAFLLNAVLEDITKDLPTATQQLVNVLEKDVRRRGDAAASK